MKTHAALAACLVVALSFASFGAELTPGNILVMKDDCLYEYTAGGVLVQSWDIPWPAGTRPITEYARDIVVSHEGDVLVYNGTFDPYLSSCDPVAGTWTHRTHSGWSTISNATYGGIAALDQYAFVTDMSSTGPGEPHGILRFTLGSSSVTPFATDIVPIDLTIGHDGLLYALSPGGSPCGRTVTVYDPVMLAHLNTIDLEAIFGHTEHRSIAVNGAGEVLIADLDGDITRIDASGNILASMNVCDHGLARNLYDIDVDAWGNVIVGNDDDEIIITNEELSAATCFVAGTGLGHGPFVTWVPQPIPEPSVLALALLGLAALAARATRRR